MESFSINATKPLSPPLRTVGLPTSPRQFKLSSPSAASSSTTLQPIVHSPVRLHDDARAKTASPFPPLGNAGSGGHSRTCSTWSATTAATSISSPPLKYIECETELLHHPRMSRQPDPVGLGIQTQEPAPREEERSGQQRRRRSQPTRLSCFSCCFGSGRDDGPSEAPRRRSPREPLEMVPDGHWTEL